MLKHAFDTLLLRDLVDQLAVSLADDHGRDLGLDAALPIALLPVRLEARFAGAADDPARTLKVRIIPDDIHIPTLETGIAPEEAVLANRYRDSGDEQTRTLAWEALVAGSGSSTARVLRAAWLVEQAEAGVVQPQPRPALTVRGLPDSWFIVAYGADRVVASATIDAVTPGLAVDPAAEAGAATWMTDFDAAVECGMGVVLDVGAASIDVLVAVGVRGGEDGAASAQELAALLDAQRFSRDVDLLAPGTPTNNSAATPSSWRSLPQVGEIRRRETAPPVGAEPDTDGRALTTALGLPADTPALSRPVAAGRSGQRDAAAMMDLLWPVTGGELLTTMLAGLGDDDIGQGAVEAARTHASRYVRGRGPLPTLLVGRQPYGVLPALSLSRWVSEGDAMLTGLLARLLTGWSIWEDAVNRVTRLGGPNGQRTATQIIAELMCQSPVPAPLGYKATTIFPPAYSLVASLRFQATLDGDLAAGLLQLPWLPLLSITGEDSKKVGSVTLDAVDPDGGGSLRSLQTGGRASIAAMMNSDLGRPDLLSQLSERALRRAGERAASYVGLLIADHVGATSLTAAIKASLVADVGSISATSTLSYAVRDFRPDAVAEFADKTLGELADDHDLLVRVFPEIDLVRIPRSPEFDAACDALEHLAGLEGPEGAVRLELLLGETLDVFSNRYDAWVTSLATRRLAEMRERRPDGIHLGAFGWLVDLDTEEAPRPGADHILAPSPAHAATAAVLRNADIDDRAASIDGSAVSRRFDVTSSPVRLARGILAAVGEGQPLSAVLGYRIERFLQDGRLLADIPALREAFGTFGGERPDPGEAAEAIPAHDVVDGVAVWAGFRDGTTARALTAEGLQALEPFLFGMMDALSDLLVAEGVHQIIGGDRTRAGATLTALASGSPLPTELRVAESPGRHVTVPVQLLMATDPGPAPAVAGWAEERPRAQLAPAAERLARSILPAPDACGLLLREGSGDAPRTVGLETLGVCALDVLAEVGADDESSPLAARVRFAADLPDGRLLPDVPDGRSVGWGALTALARAWARVFGSSRPLLAGDVAIGPERGAPPAAPLDPGALAAAAAAAAHHVERLVAATAALHTRVDALGATAPDASFVADVSAALETFRAAGLAGTAQEPVRDPVAVLGLARRCIAAGVSAGRRWQQLDADAAADHPRVAERPGADDVSERTERLVAAVRDVFGDVVVVAPAVSASSLIVRAQDAPPACASVDDLADWMGELSEVRTATRRWWQAVLATEAVVGRGASLLPTQLPEGVGDWIGGFVGPQVAWRPPVGARRAFVTHVPEPFGGDAVSALVVESWQEQVPLGFEHDPNALLDPAEGAGEPAPGDALPANSEPAGVATHYNAAGARPPQSILLAVAPDPAAATWKLGDLVATLLETLELSRFRAIEPSTDLPSRSILPAIFVPDGIAGVSFPSKLLERMAEIDSMTIKAHARSFGDER